MVCNESLLNVINKEITWLWKPFIPMGKVTLIQGDTGMGKTNILIKLLADLSCGWYPPTLFRGELQKREQKDPVYSYYVSIENGIDDTIAPLFDMMLGNRKYIQFQDEKKGHFVLCGEDVRAVAEKTGSTVLVVDPWQQFLPENFSTSNNHALRDMIRDIQTAAEDTGMAIILAGNYNKSIAAEIRRGLGGAELNNTLRSVISVMPGNEPDVREIRSVKMSFIGKESNPILIRQLDDYNLEYMAGGYEARNTGDRAIEFLNDLLAKGPVDSNEVKQKAKEAGFAPATLQRAKTKAGILSRRLGDRSCLWEGQTTS